MTAAATAITAECRRNLNVGTDSSSSAISQCRGRSPGLITNYARHHSAPRNGLRIGSDSERPNLVESPSNPVSKARREFFQTNITPRRIKASEGSSGYMSNSSGDSDLVEDRRMSRDSSSNDSDLGRCRNTASCPESPENRGSNAKYGNAFSSPSSSSSANSLTFSSGASLGGCVNDLRSTYTEEILKVLEEDGLVFQTFPRDSLSPLPSSVCERRASADYNVIELSRQYKKKELSQLRTSGDKLQLINDTFRLQQMLDATEDEEKRRAIRQRIIELKCGYRNKENAYPNGQRMRSLSTREMVPSPAKDERKFSAFGSPIRDPTAQLGGIASLTLPGSPTYSPNGQKSTTPSGQTTKIIARTPAEIKAALLRWCQIKTRGYPNVLITNFTRSWSDGMAFCALVHHFFPNAFEFSDLHPKNRRENFELAFRIAEEMAGIVPLLDVDDMISMGDNPEYKCIYTYVQAMYKNLHNLEIQP